MKWVALASLVFFAAACGDMGSATDGGDAARGAPHDAATPADLATPADASQARDMTQAPDLAPAIPIQHVIVIVKENHTFDNYFGTFPGAEGTTTCQLKDGTQFACPRAPNRMPRDLNHGNNDALTDWAGGKCDGWEDVPAANDNNDHLAWAQYLEADIPNYWQYARHFTLADHFFANELGPSFPGHMFTVAAQAGWALDNPPTSNIFAPYWGCDEGMNDRVSVQDQMTCTAKDVFPCFKIPAIPDILPQGVDWKFYGTNFYVLPEVWSMLDAVDGIRNGPGWKQVVNVSEFTNDVKNHTLPAVTWLVDQDFADEHPLVGSVCDGENWTVGYVNQIMGSDYWNSTAILFTMDDFGGWVDHVKPPRQYGCDKNAPYGLGFRLPLIIISPYAKEGFVFQEQSEHASIARFIERVFGAKHTLSDLDPAAQDGQANDLFGAFDFTQKPLPPLTLQTRQCPP